MFAADQTPLEGNRIERANCRSRCDHANQRTYAEGPGAGGPDESTGTTCRGVRAGPRDGGRLGGWVKAVLASIPEHQCVAVGSSQCDPVLDNDRACFTNRLEQACPGDPA